MEHDRLGAQVVAQVDVAYARGLHEGGPGRVHHDGAVVQDPGQGPGYDHRLQSDPVEVPAGASARRYDYLPASRGRGDARSARTRRHRQLPTHVLLLNGPPAVHRPTVKGPRGIQEHSTEHQHAFFTR